ncbi:hypothetical protein ACKAV7_011435 [Fusarium commune]|nr:hypothetical protein LZL87_009966 [Fusarium oxysporum]
MKAQGMPGTGPNPRLATRFLNDVGTNFKQLECLVMGEFLNPKFTWGQHQFRNRAAKVELDTMILKVIMALNSMPKLVRFAFVLSENTLGTHNYFIGDDEWHPWVSGRWGNPNGQAEWYSRVVCNMSSLLPSLEQLCIKAQPSVYCRGIRNPGDQKMAVTWKTEQQETDDEFGNFFV